MRTHVSMRGAGAGGGNLPAASNIQELPHLACAVLQQRAHNLQPWGIPGAHIPLPASPTLNPCLLYPELSPAPACTAIWRVKHKELPACASRHKPPCSRRQRHHAARWRRRQRPARAPRAARRWWRAAAAGGCSTGGAGCEVQGLGLRAQLDGQACPEVGSILVDQDVACCVAERYQAAHQPSQAGEGGLAYCRVLRKHRGQQVSRCNWEQSEALMSSCGAA